MAGEPGFIEHEAGEVSNHQHRDEQGDDSGFGRNFTQPTGAKNEASETQIHDSDNDRNGNHGDEAHVDAAEDVFPREEWEAEAKRKVVKGDEGEGEKAPKNQGMGSAGDGALFNNFGLEEDLPDEIGEAAREIAQYKAGIGFGGRDDFRDFTETSQKNAH